MVSPTCLVTAGLDKMIKVWSIPAAENLCPASKATLTAQFKVDQEVMQLGYSHDQKLLAYLDSECTIGVVPMTPQLLNATSQIAEAAADDDIDIEDLDEACLEDDDEQVDNIDMGDMKDALADSNDEE